MWIGAGEGHTAWRVRAAGKWPCWPMGEVTRQLGVLSLWRWQAGHERMAVSGQFAHRVEDLPNGPEPELVPFLMGTRVGDRLECCWPLARCRSAGSSCMGSWPRVGAGSMCQAMAGAMRHFCAGRHAGLEDGRLWGLGVTRRSLLLHGTWDASCTPCMGRKLWGLPGEVVWAKGYYLCARGVKRTQWWSFGRLGHAWGRERSGEAAGAGLVLRRPAELGRWALELACSWWKTAALATRRDGMTKTKTNCDLCWSGKEPCVAWCASNGICWVLLIGADWNRERRARPALGFLLPGLVGWLGCWACKTG